MTQKKFLQLVNLYLDREITPAQLERLRREVSRRPERRNILEEYIFLDRASHRADFDFSDAPAPLLPMPWVRITAGASLVTAACLALVVTMGIQDTAAPAEVALNNESLPSDQQASIDFDPAATFASLPSLELSPAMEEPAEDRSGFRFVERQNGAERRFFEIDRLTQGDSFATGASFSGFSAERVRFNR